MDKLVGKTSGDYSYLWFVLDEYPEHYYGISENFEIESLMFADENDNGGDLNHLSIEEKQDIIGTIRKYMDNRLQ